MNKALIKLQNCYGIPELEHEFDFSNNNMSVALYAPNGMMKTSLAKSFHDYILGKNPKDEIYPELESNIVIHDENSSSIDPENIFVVDSINEKYQSKKISTLLASEDLKEQYDEIFNAVGSKREHLLKKLKPLSGLTKGIDEAFTQDFSLPSGDFLVAIARLEREVKSEKHIDYANFKYKTIFNDKVLNFISNPDFESVIAEYTQVYDQILDNSKYFKKGVFNHSNAETVTKILKSNGWFEGGHSVSLKNEDNQFEITNEEALTEAIEQEKDAILSDPRLKDMFTKVDKALSNAELKAFREYLINNPSLVPELKNIKILKTKLWMGYLTQLKDDYLDLLSIYDESEEKIKQIIAQAEAQQTRWESVIDIFNERFSVPFNVVIENKGDAVLNISSPQITFYFKNFDDQEKKVDRTLLDKVLSNGEKRALYILNIVFEVEARRKNSTETLFLIDDIADSFDYKNKYAIIEYLHDMKDEDFFHLILLTHNYDFYRTVRGRLGIYSPNKLIASRDQNKIYLNEDDVDINPFKNWLTKLDEKRYVVASIPFIRNLSEYIGDDAAFNDLTSLLHIKENSQEISFKEISIIYKRIIPTIENIIENDEKVIDSIFSECETILNDSTEGVQLDKKIVLSIGIRLRAEQILIREINDGDYVLNITKNQTSKLIKKYGQSETVDEDILKLIRQVGLMTPENIHLNSFMFEPILDMSIHHLKTLYQNINDLLVT